jgi:hypothetical protein
MKPAVKAARSMNENAVAAYPHAPVQTWRPQFPSGRIECVYMHWSGHDYRTVFPAYHLCIALDEHDRIVVVETHDLRENMREVYVRPELPYAAHTRGRNSFAAGVSIMAMEGATPQDFGSYPLTGALVDALCLVCARIAAFYEIPVDAAHVMTHAEAALHDGYFGSGSQERWDIARLRAEPRPLIERDAIDTGDALRSMTRRSHALGEMPER